MVAFTYITHESAMLTQIFYTPLGCYFSNGHHLTASLDIFHKANKTQAYLDIFHKANKTQACLF